MAVLPYSRVVNVTLTRSDNYVSKRGFGTTLILTNESVSGTFDATTRTVSFASMDEVAAVFASTTEAYAAFEVAFSQNPRPLTVKAGYVAFVKTTAGEVTATTEAELKAELDAITEFDNDWYWLTITASMRDHASLDGAIEWTEARAKIAILDSNDPNMELLANTTNIAARNKGSYERTAIFYSVEVDEYPAVALAAYLGTRNFDEANSHYTAKFKKLNGITPLNKGSGVVQIVTGFVPALGQAVSAGHLANCYVNIGGQYFVVEGSTLTANVFIDEVHATDWIIARTEEETLNVMLNNAAIPYTDAGMELLASGARVVMTSASRAGLIANDLDPETGGYAASVEYTIPSVFDVPASQRKARIAPDIAVTFRYAGAVHYSTINYTMTF